MTCYICTLHKEALEFGDEDAERTLRPGKCGRCGGTKVQSATRVLHDGVLYITGPSYAFRGYKTQNRYKVICKRYALQQLGGYTLEYGTMPCGFCSGHEHSRAAKKYARKVALAEQDNVDTSSPAL